MNLSDSQKQALREELIRYKQDPIYFLTNNVRLPSLDKMELINMYQAQKDALILFLKHHFLVINKSRQIGGSTSFQLLCVYLVTFYSGYNIVVISKDGSASTKFVQDIKTMLDSLPNYLKLKRVVDNVQDIVLSNRSSIKAKTIKSDQPDSVLRGETVHFLIIDEAAHIKKISTAYRGMVSTIATASRRAEKLGIPYGIVALSSPNGTQGDGKWFFDLWQSALNKTSSFVAKRIHYSEAPFADKQWYDLQVSLLHNDYLAIRQELELEFIGNEASFFDPKISETLMNSKISDADAIAEEKKYFDTNGNNIGYATRRVFKPIEENEFYLISIDISSSYSDCNSAIQVIKYKTMEQIEEFVGKLPIYELENEIKELAKKYENCLIIPENNSYGVEMVQNLDNDSEVTDKLYKTKIFDVDGKLLRLIPGINTNAKTKPKMIEALYWVITTDPKRIKSEALSNELLSLRKNFKSDELTDLTMAYAFSCYVSKYDNEDIDINLASYDSGSINFFKSIINSSR
jgi:hypothetical protein